VVVHSGNRKKSVFAQIEKTRHLQVDASVMEQLREGYARLAERSAVGVPEPRHSLP
jgi:hypothetical protein